MTCEKRAKKWLFHLSRAVGLVPSRQQQRAVHVCCVCVYYHFNKQALFLKVALDVFGILDDIIPQSH